MGSLGYLAAKPQPFLCKTYQIVEDSSIDQVISWNESGTSFIVWRPMDFARDVLPRHFKHNNFASFVRQLNTYGFRKIALDRWEFSNDFFRRGEKRLLCDIRRQKVNHGAADNEERLGRPISVLLRKARGRVASSPDGHLDMIMDDNERLRRENTNLTQELTYMKEFCGNNHLMMSSHKACPRQRFEGGDCTWTTLSTAVPMKHMIPPPGVEWPLGRDGGVRGSMECAANMDCVDAYTMLFGVPIGVKREGDRVGSDTGPHRHGRPS